jgi:predicted PurR-regulated permease PerM
MGRFVSLIVLLASIVVIGALFYKVMIGFFVPCFLAAILVIVFRPLHRWVLERVGNREHTAAGITTTLIVISVLFPTALALVVGGIQGTRLIGNINPSSISVGLDNARKSFQLDSPSHAIVREIDLDIAQMQAALGTMSIDQKKDVSGAFAGLDRKLQGELDSLLPSLASHYVSEVKIKVKEARESSPKDVVFDSAAVESSLQEEADSEYKEKATVWGPAIQSVKDSLTELEADTIRDVIELRAKAVQLGTTWQAAKEKILGGENAWLGSSIWATLVDIANPSEQQINDFTKSALEYVQPTLISATSATAEFLIRLSIGTAVMLVSLYFFLYDGPGMVKALMKLSPLDDRYEMELLEEFDRVTRAIVLAMILSAIVQGFTAGIGYYFAGMPSLLLLTVLSILCGLIPFVGPGVVWIPVCCYLSFYLGEHTKAILLAIWGMLAVASVDNVVKAYVLHGQSQLHPLFALLSVLGGVSSLGPIGILVGPIIVVILQTLLTILQREITHLDQTSVVTTELPKESPTPEATTLATTLATKPAAETVVATIPSTEPSNDVAAEDTAKSGK